MGLEILTKQQEQPIKSPMELPLSKLRIDMLEEGETSFLTAERIRQVQGLLTLDRLLVIGDDQINQILGIESLPPGLDFEKDFLRPSDIHEVQTIVEIPDDCPYERLKGIRFAVVGARVQVNIIGTAEDHDTPTGGGVRIKLEYGELEKETETWKFKSGDGDEEMAEIIEEASALATTMTPKITVLDFPTQTQRFLDQVDLPPGIRSALKERAARALPSGGAKGDFSIALPDIEGGLSEEEITHLIGRSLYQIGYILGERGAIGPGIDRLAGDVRTGRHHPDGKAVLNDLAEGYCAAVKEKLEKQGIPWTEALERYHMTAVTGKTGKYGLEARGDATGWGGWVSIVETEKQIALLNGWLLDEDGFPIHLRETEIFIRGIGNAVCRAAEEAAKNGCRIQAIADLGHLIIFEDGAMRQEDARELLSVSTQGKLPDGTKMGNIAEWARWQISQDSSRKIKIEFDYDSLQSACPEEKIKAERETKTAEVVNRYYQGCQKPLIVFEAALQGTINKKNANLIPKKSRMYEFANGPVTPLGAQVLRRKGIIVVPGIGVNCGGVDASMFEWLKGILDLEGEDVFTTKEVERSVAEVIQKNVEDVFRLMELAESQMTSSPTMEELFYALAIARGIRIREEFREKTGRKPEPVVVYQGAD